MKNFLITSISTLMLTALLVQPSLAQQHGNHNHGNQHQCHQHSGHDHEMKDSHDHTDAFESVSDDFRAELTKAVETYISAKDELFESNLNSAKSEFEAFKDSIEAIGKHTVSGDGHVAWMESYDKLIEHAEAITASKDLDEARLTFRHLSNELIHAVNQFGIEGVVYHQYCPMAFNNEGANWLSTNEQVQNPYLPDTMPGCGQVIERIET
ncbi:MAG: DUF3347 domain-containing protein [Balneolaceae bacterium]